MSRIDRVALILCMVSLFINAIIASLVFGNIPYLEDEYTLVWQAEVMARGQILIPSPPSPESFLVPFVIDVNGWRFGKYPLGFPALLSIGIILNGREWVNPIIAAWGLWLVYRLVKKILGEKTALLATFLMACSPFYLMNSASLLTHAWTLFLSTAFALAWVDVFFYSTPHQMLACTVAGLSLGVLALTRPLTAIGVAVPFFIHGLILLWRSPGKTRVKVIGIGMVAGLVTSIHFLWQAALTGSPWINPYTLWWPYDQVGFGPGHGYLQGGHTLAIALNDANASLRSLADDLFGWRWLSWFFLPFGVLSVYKNRAAWLTGAVFFTLVLVYMAYWVGASLYGPRYYYEGLYSLMLLSAGGIEWLYQRLARFRLGPKTCQWLLVICLAMLVIMNLVFYTPVRLKGIPAQFGVGNSELTSFKASLDQVKKPALVIVHCGPNWRDYGVLLNLANPFLDSPMIFALSLDSEIDRRLSVEFHDRSIYDYYPENATLILNRLPQ